MTGLLVGCVIGVLVGMADAPVLDRPLPWWQTAGLHTYSHGLLTFPPLRVGAVPHWAREQLGQCLRHPTTGEWWFLPSLPDARLSRCERQHPTAERTPCAEAIAVVEGHRPSHRLPPPGRPPVRRAGRGDVADLPHPDARDVPSAS